MELEISRLNSQLMREYRLQQTLWETEAFPDAVTSLIADFAGRGSGVHRRHTWRTEGGSDEVRDIVGDADRTAAVG
jgi:hypothetical protein